MKKLTQEEAFGQVVHFVKSPLVSIHALGMTLARITQKKKQADVVSINVTHLNKKIAELHTRLELFFTYVQLREGLQLSFNELFSLISLVEGIKGKLIFQKRIVSVRDVPSHELLGDRRKLAEVISSSVLEFFQNTSSSKPIRLSFVEKKSEVSLVFSGSVGKKQNSSNRFDPEVYVKEFLADEIIKQHGGKVSRKASVLTIALSRRLKPQKSG